jgi:hypothetical protein
MANLDELLIDSIPDASLSNKKMGNDSIDSRTLAPLATGTEHIQDAAITTEKLDAPTYEDLKTGRRNLLSNGALRIWQRGDAFGTAGSAYYGPDQVKLSNITSCVRGTTANNSGLSSLDITSTIGSVMIIVPLDQIGGLYPLLASTVYTFSFYSNAATVDTVLPRFRNVPEASTSEVQLAPLTFTSTLQPSGVYRHVALLDIGAAVPNFDNTCLVLAMTASTGNSFSQFQLEKGSRVTPFEFTRHSEDEAECMGWFQIPFDDNDAGGAYYSTVYQSAGTSGNQDNALNTTFRPKMRLTPTVVDEVWRSGVAPSVTNLGRNSMRLLWVDNAGGNNGFGPEHLAISCEL